MLNAQRRKFLLVRNILDFFYTQSKIMNLKKNIQISFNLDEKRGGGSGWLIFLILLIVAGAGGFWYYQEKQKHDAKRFY